MAWSKPSPSSHTGAVTGGAASQLYQGSCLSPWLDADCEASLLLLTCKITLHPCAAAFPSPQAGLEGYPGGLSTYTLLQYLWVVKLAKGAFNSLKGL